MEERKTLISGAENLGISLSDEQIEQFITFYRFLVEKNKVMNLTAITEWDDVVTKHFLDSLSLAQVVMLKGQKLLDMGTGAGFPGLPLKIAFPDLKVTLVDSLDKRISFLEEVIELLGLTGIDAIHQRAEEIGRDASHREQYDICVSRAVAPLPILAEYCLPLVKKDGIFVAYKGGDFLNEWEESQGAINVLGGKRKEPSLFTLFGTEQKRSLLVIEKINDTPDKYPRRSGVPKKKPLS